MLTMTEPINLIKNSEPVRRITVAPGRGRVPSVAVVYATRDGDLEVLDGGKPMRWSDQMLTRYRTRFEVDISDHHLFFELKDDVALPTQADVYHFHATVSASFRVADPAEVIRRNVQDASALVRGHVLGVCRPITRMFSIEEAEEAESAIRARFRRDTLIQGGISLYAVEVRLSLDAAARQYLQDLERADRDDKINAAQHVRNVNDANRQGQLDLLKQTQDHVLQERERLMLNGQPMDMASMIRLHLQRNPHDTAAAMKMMAELEQVRFENQQKQTDRMQSLLAAFANDGLLNPAEVSDLVQAVVRHMESSAGAITAGATLDAPVSAQPEPPPALTWNESLDDILGSAVPPPASSGPEPPAANLCPIYLVIDESVNDTGWTDGLDTAITDLIGDIAASPRVASALRLAVLGFAETVEIRIPLGPVPTAAVAPEIASRGPADFGALFSWLRQHVNPDHDLLSAQHPSVRAPVLVVLCADDPRDSAWEALRRRMPGQLGRAEIVVFGVGAATEAVADIASHPDLAFLGENVATDRAIGLFAAFLHQYVLSLGKSALDGTQAAPPDPAGFRPADGTP
jgi:uncharacterized protein YegL